MKYLIILLCIMWCSVSWVSAINQPAIISRAQRWADESLRLGRGGPVTDVTKVSEAKRAAAIRRQTADRYLVNNYAREFKVDSTITTRNGKPILRHVSLNNNKFKIVIHHTARSPVTDSYADVVTELLDIYKFHTVNRGRGDIGYNYIIWPNGEIFEWRVGGPSAVAAHAVNNNGGSIGISLMGNFDLTEPSPAQLDATIQLTTRLAQQYSIDVYKQVMYHEASNEEPYIADHTDDSLVWHKDTGDTACPGKNLYKKLTTIKSQVSGIVWGKIPYDPTPIITDPVRYYIPNTTYTLNIPWNTSTAVSSCVIDGQIWSIGACTLSGQTLSLTLNKLANQSHQGTHRIVVTNGTTKYYLYLNLEYHTILATTWSVVWIPNKSDYFTGSMVDVMLYDLSTSQNLWTIICAQWCRITLNTNSPITLKANTAFQVSKSWSWSNSKLYFWRGNKKVAINQLTVTSIGDASIAISNYGRTQDKVSLNEWKGSLTRSTNTYTQLWGANVTGVVIINRIRMDDYMRGLVIGQRDLPQSYHDVMYLIAHTNARYRTDLTDNATIHQYYGWSNAASLNYKRQLSNDTMNKKVLQNNTNLTYAPWFECSDGRTRNGVVDLGVCPDGKQSGNGVWLSRLGAVWLSQRWYTASQIIDYYFPGISIAQLP